MSAAPFFTSEVEGIELLRCRPFHEAGVPHGFTARSGGFGSRENGRRDGERLSRALGFSRYSAMQQVHGSEVLDALDGEAPTCDGVVTDRRGVALMVQSADCVPLLFWATELDAVAAVHAGWRGTLARITSKAVRMFESRFGARPGEIEVALGPAIRVCCYEVGDEVIDRVPGAELVSRPGPRGRRHLDLLELNRRELLEAGVPEAQIYDCGVCTSCENERFYSYRREGSAAGRIFGAIGIA